MKESKYSADKGKPTHSVGLKKKKAQRTECFLHPAEGHAGRNA